MNATELAPARAPVEAAPFASTKRVLVALDLCGFARLFQREEDAEIAVFVTEYYARCQARIAESAGAVIKFMGDGCLAVFPGDQALGALEAVGAIARDVEALARRHELEVSVAANVHLASVVDAEFGTGELRRRDVLGRGVNQTYLLGRGPGFRISEPVYRSLPSAARSAWTKHKPPAIYHLAESGELLGGLGQSPGENTARF